jgi:hypothetical protein
MIRRFLNGWLDFLAWLGGADPALLNDEQLRQLGAERGRFVAMAGVLLTTAGVASVSMFFALSHGVGIAPGWSVVFGLLWGLAIFNIDRFLVVSLSGTRGHFFQMFAITVPRLILAALLALVISEPLVLQIFKSDISAELPILQQQQSKTFANQLRSGADARQITTDTNQIASIQAQINAVNSGGGSTGGGQIAQDQQAVNNLTGQVNAAKAKASAAYLKWQCEAGGLKGSQCPPDTSGLVGQGPLANSDEQAYNSLEDSVTSLQGQLAAAQKQLSSDEGLSQQQQQQEQSSRTQQVDKLTAQLNALIQQKQQLQQKIGQLISADDATNSGDHGLLEQIQALDAASALNPGLEAAHIVVLLLFFAIEILPVSVKVLLMIGRKTVYERIAEDREEAVAELAHDERVTQRRMREIGATARYEAAEAGHRNAAQDAEIRAEITRRELTADRTVADGKAQVREAVELDMRGREEGIGKKANERVEAEIVSVVETALVSWGEDLRDGLAKLREKQHANGQHGPDETTQEVSYEMPDGDGQDGGQI